MERGTLWSLPAVFLVTAGMAADLPQLRLSSLTGRLRVHPPEELARTLRAETAAALPELMPGTKVEVVEGEAVFESDVHAVVRAAAGSAFTYHAEADVLRIASVPGAAPVDVEVAGSRLRLAGGGSVALAEGGALEVEQSEVELLAGSVLREGESITVAVPGRPGRGFTPGDGLALGVPEERGYLLVAAAPADLRLAAYEIGRALPRALARLPSPLARARAPEAAPKAEPEPLPAAEQEEMRMAVGPAPTLRPVPRPRPFPAEGVPPPTAERGLTRDQWAVLGIISGTALLAGLELWRHLDRS